MSTTSSWARRERRARICSSGPSPRIVRRTDADAVLEGASDRRQASRSTQSTSTPTACRTWRSARLPSVRRPGPCPATVDLASDATWVFEGPTEDDTVGSSVVDAGDVTGDGIDDLAVVATAGNGTVYVVDGGAASGDYRDRSRGQCRDRRSGCAGFSALVVVVVTTDYDGDGTIDLIRRRVRGRHTWNRLGRAACTHSSAHCPGRST